MIKGLSSSTLLPLKLDLRDRLGLVFGRDAAGDKVRNTVAQRLGVEILAGHKNALLARSNDQARVPKNASIIKKKG